MSLQERRDRNKGTQGEDRSRGRSDIAKKYQGLLAKKKKRTQKKQKKDSYMF
jgi:hypothetical protein